MSTASYRHWIATALAHALLADAQRPGGHAADAFRARAAACFEPVPAWLAPLLGALLPHLHSHWREHTVPTLADHIAALPALDAAFASAEPPRMRRLILRPARMVPAPFELAALELPPLSTLAALAQWLEVSPERLGWLLAPAQDFREQAHPSARHCPPGLHYHALLKPKARGGLRLLEVPKPELKRVQRQVLAGLLDRVPVHEAAHGFVKGRDVGTHAALHAGQGVVLAFDLRDFFHSIRRARVRAVWRTLGYPEGVADALARLCTVRTPRGVRERLQEEGGLDALRARALEAAHLAQGAPTSPALANLCAFNLDLRLDGLAWRFGARYSRYADDIVFSLPCAGEREQRALAAWVEAIAEAEGFVLNPAKTRALPQHRRQQVTGLVVNERPNLARDAYDLLRAQLHHAMRAPCDAAHIERLRGQVAWACRWVSASRAAKLRAMLEKIPHAD